MLLLGIVGALMVLGTPAHAQNYPWCAQYSGRALGGAQNCGFVSFAQCHGNRFRHRWFLRAKHDVPAAGTQVSEKEKLLMPGVASPALAFLLNAAIWRHHIDGGSRNSSDPRCGKFNRGVVNVEIKNCFVLISVYFIVAVVHGVKLPSSSANFSLTRAKSLV